MVEHHLNAREIRLDHASDRVRKTYEYLSQFSIQQNRSNMDALREYVKPQIAHCDHLILRPVLRSPCILCRKLASSFPSITDFEVCALANLAPGDAEEAKLMVPSLAVCHSAGR